MLYDIDSSNSFGLKVSDFVRSSLSVPCLSEGNSVLSEEKNNFDLTVLLGKKKHPKNP